jgi:hypothetical protein
VTEPPDIPVTRDAAGALADDFPCRRCGYNLRGLKPTGRCPECGQPVQTSLTDERLRYSDPAWVRKLAIGVRMLHYALLLTPLIPVAVTLLALFDEGGLGIPPQWTQTTAVSAAIALLAGAAWAALLLVMPEPHRPPGRERAWMGRLVRACTMAGSVSVAVLINGIGVPPGIRLVLVLLLAGLIVTGWFALLVQLCELARRIGDAELIRLCDRASIIAAVLTVAVGFALVLLSVNVSNRFDTVTIVPVSILIATVALILWANSVAVTHRLGRALAAERRLAEAPNRSDDA